MLSQNFTARSAVNTGLMSANSSCITRACIGSGRTNSVKIRTDFRQRKKKSNSDKKLSNYFCCKRKH